MEGVETSLTEPQQEAGQKAQQPQAKTRILAPMGVRRGMSYSHSLIKMGGDSGPKGRKERLLSTETLWRIQIIQDREASLSSGSRRMSGSPSAWGGIRHRDELLRKRRKVAERLLMYCRLEPAKGPSRMHCFNLFMYLWAANDQGQSCPLVQIPDTMIIHNGQPIAWLFTDRATGLLLKKSSLKQRDFDAVYKSFSTGGERDMGLGKVKALHVTPHDMAQHKVLVNHMDAETLYSFLKRKHFKDGLLQKFMMPFGKRNVVYSAFWYPNFFYLERTIMNARPRPLAEFDYPFVSKEKPLPKEDVSLLLRQRLQAICNSIVDHIYDVSPQKYKIAHMRLIFKNDIQGHLWLLFCYDLRLQREISIQRISHTSPTQQQLTSSHRSSHESDGATQRPQSAGSLGSGMGGDMQLKASEGTMKRSSSSTEFNHPVGDRTGAASGIDKYDISKRDDGSREDYHRDGYGMKSGWELKDRQGSRETRGDSGAAVQRLRTETDFSTNYSARLNRRSVLLYQPAGYLQAVSSAAFGEDSENKTLQAQHRHSLLKDISWVATTDVVQSITEELAEEHEAHQLKRRRSGEVDLGGGDEGKSGAGAMLLGQVKIAKSELGGFGFHGIGVHSSELQFPSAMGAGAGHQPSRPGWLLSAGLQAGGRPTNLEGKERRVDEHEIAAKSQAPPDDAAHMVENRPRLSSSDNEPDQEFGGELTDDETNLWWTDYEPTRIWLRTRTRDVNRRTLPWFEPFHYRGVVPMPLRRKSSRERARFPRLSPGHHYSSSWQRSARLQSGASVRSSMHSGWSMMDHGNHDAGRERESFRLPSTAPGSSVLGSNGDIGGYGEAHLSSTTEFPPMTLTEGVRGQRDGHEVEANYHAQGNFEKQGDHNHDHNHHNHHHHHHYRHMPQHVDTATAEHDDVEAPNPPPAECNHHVSSSDTGHNGPDHEQVVRVDPGKSGDDTSKGVVVAPRSGSGRARKRLKQDRNWFRKGGNGGRRRKDVEQDSKRREQSSLLQSSTEGRTAMGAVSSGPSAAEHIAQTVSSPSSPDLVLSSNPSSILTSPPNTSWEKQEDFSRSDPQHEDPSTGTGLHSSSKLRHHSKELSSDANLGTDIPSPKTLEVDGEVGEGGTDAEVHIPAAVRDQLPNWEKWWESITEVDWVSEAGIGDKFRRTFVETPRKPGFPRAKWPPEKGYTVKDQRKQESKAEPKLFTAEIKESERKGLRESIMRKAAERVREARGVDDRGSRRANVPEGSKEVSRMVCVIGVVVEVWWASRDHHIAPTILIRQPRKEKEGIRLRLEGRRRDMQEGDAQQERKMARGCRAGEQVYEWRSAKALKGTMDDLVAVPDHGVTEPQLVQLFYHAIPEALRGHFFDKSQQADMTYDVLSREVVLHESKSMPVTTFWHKDLEKGKKWKDRTISGQVKAKDPLILTLEEGGTKEVPYDQIEWGLENDGSSVGQGRSYAAVAAGGRPQGGGGG
ncbi:hypothetical protein CBR_g23947 [Chara braunii]|uniref:Uncharacterized protein n=1 Tax=Chara braunii TaxID=69332 RepID=A0A388L5I5_CHABU|nr:hypothetical protein CBR_g23947 [Chara braunii]|eukprot:GBG77502.1 hypothetical protein CBR_g23947 [Chara braunii]